MLLQLHISLNHIITSSGSPDLEYYCQLLRCLPWPMENRCQWNKAWFSLISFADTSLSATDPPDTQLYTQVAGGLGLQVVLPYSNSRLETGRSRTWISTTNCKLLIHVFQIMWKMWLCLYSRQSKEQTIFFLTYLNVSQINKHEKFQPCDRPPNFYKI